MQIGKKAKTNAIRYLLVALYFLLTVFFFLEFVLLNNSPMILYSFLIFIAIGIIAGFYESVSKSMVIAALAFIILGSLLYFAFAGFSTIGINVAIIGYYFLISAVIGIFISVMIENNDNPKIRKKVTGFVKKRSEKIAYAGIIIALVLLLGPFWPQSAAVARSQYINVSLPYYYNVSAQSYSNYSVAMSPTPYYMSNPVCISGSNVTLSISFTSSDTIDVFFFSNGTFLSEVENSTFGNMPFTTYLDAFSGHNNGKAIESKSGSITGHMMNGCGYIVLLSNYTVSAKFHVRADFIQQDIAYEIKSVPAPNAIRVINSTGNILQSIGFLELNYRNLTNLTNNAS